MAHDGPEIGVSAAWNGDYASSHLDLAHQLDDI